jgi:hypothetical protein
MKNVIVLVLVAILSFTAGVMIPRSNQESDPLPQATREPKVETPRRIVPIEKEVTPDLASSAPISDSLVPNSSEVNAISPLKKLLTLHLVPGSDQRQTTREILFCLEQLAHEGATALPEIREFLSTFQDIPYQFKNGKRNELMPPSLRIGLFDVIRRIGGSEAEKILSETLDMTGQGGEVTHLSRLLEEMAPGRYRHKAIASARELLSASNAALSSGERNALYNLLTQMKDTSLLGVAQTQLKQKDGKIDAAALNYLQKSMGKQTLPLASRLYSDSTVTSPESKESLARVGLSYVGSDPQAVELFHAAVVDPKLKPEQRRNLVEDLNEHGLSNKKNPSAEDRKIILSRYTLTENYLKESYVQSDKVLREAFQEANKDLKKMLERP